MIGKMAIFLWLELSLSFERKDEQNFARIAKEAIFAMVRSNSLFCQILSFAKFCLLPNSFIVETDRSAGRTFFVGWPLP